MTSRAPPRGRYHLKVSREAIARARKQVSTSQNSQQAWKILAEILNDQAVKLHDTGSDSAIEQAVAWHDEAADIYASRLQAVAGHVDSIISRRLGAEALRRLKRLPEAIESMNDCLESIKHQEELELLKERVNIRTTLVLSWADIVEVAYDAGVDCLGAIWWQFAGVAAARALLDTAEQNLAVATEADEQQEATQLLYKAHLNVAAFYDSNEEQQMVLSHLAKSIDLCRAQRGSGSYNKLDMAEVQHLLDCSMERTRVGERIAVPENIEQMATDFSNQLALAQIAYHRSSGQQQQQQYVEAAANALRGVMRTALALDQLAMAQNAMDSVTERIRLITVVRDAWAEGTQWCNAYERTSQLVATLDAEWLGCRTRRQAGSAGDAAQREIAFLHHSMLPQLKSLREEHELVVISLIDKERTVLERLSTLYRDHCDHQYAPWHSAFWLYNAWQLAHQHFVYDHSARLGTELAAAAQALVPVNRMETCIQGSMLHGAAQSLLQADIVRERDSDAIEWCIAAIEALEHGIEVRRGGLKDTRRTDLQLPLPWNIPPTNPGTVPGSASDDGGGDENRSDMLVPLQESDDEVDYGELVMHDPATLWKMLGPRRPDGEDDDADSSGNNATQSHDDRTHPAAEEYLAALNTLVSLHCAYNRLKDAQTTCYVVRDWMQTFGLMPKDPRCASWLKQLDTCLTGRFDVASLVLKWDNADALQADTGRPGGTPAAAQAGATTENAQASVSGASGSGTSARPSTSATPVNSLAALSKVPASTRKPPTSAPIPKAMASAAAPAPRRLAAARLRAEDDSDEEVEADLSTPAAGSALQGAAVIDESGGQFEDLVDAWYGSSSHADTDTGRNEAVVDELQWWNREYDGPELEEGEFVRCAMSGDTDIECIFQEERRRDRTVGGLQGVATVDTSHWWWSATVRSFQVASLDVLGGVQSDLQRLGDTWLEVMDTDMELNQAVAREIKTQLTDTELLVQDIMKHINYLSVIDRLKADQTREFPPKSTVKASLKTRLLHSHELKSLTLKSLTAERARRAADLAKMRDSLCVRLVRLAQRAAAAVGALVLVAPLYTMARTCATSWEKLADVLLQEGVCLRDSVQPPDLMGAFRRFRQSLIAARREKRGRQREGYRKSAKIRVPSSWMAHCAAFIEIRNTWEVVRPVVNAGRSTAAACALICIRKALALARVIGDQNQRTRCYCNIGLNYFVADRVAEHPSAFYRRMNRARSHLSKAVQTCRLLNNPGPLRALASFHMAQAHIAKARRHRLEARRIDMPVSAQRRAFCTSMANKSLTAATEVLMRFGEERREGATPEQYILLAECTFLQGDWKTTHQHLQTAKDFMPSEDESYNEKYNNLQAATELKLEFRRASQAVVLARAKLQQNEAKLKRKGKTEQLFSLRKACAEPLKQALQILEQWDHMAVDMTAQMFQWADLYQTVNAASQLSNLDAWVSAVVWGVDAVCKQGESFHAADTALRRLHRRIKNVGNTLARAKDEQATRRKHRLILHMQVCEARWRTAQVSWDSLRAGVAAQQRKVLQNAVDANSEALSATRSGQSRLEAAFSAWERVRDTLEQATTPGDALRKQWDKAEACRVGSVLQLVVSCFNVACDGLQQDRQAAQRAVALSDGIEEAVELDDDDELSANSADNGSSAAKAGRQRGRREVDAARRILESARGVPSQVEEAAVQLVKKWIPSRLDVTELISSYRKRLAPGSLGFVAELPVALTRVSWLARELAGTGASPDGGGADSELRRSVDEVDDSVLVDEPMTGVDPAVSKSTTESASASATDSVRVSTSSGSNGSAASKSATEERLPPPTMQPSAATTATAVTISTTAPLPAVATPAVASLPISPVAPAPASATKSATVLATVPVIDLLELGSAKRKRQSGEESAPVSVTSPPLPSTSPSAAASGATRQKLAPNTAAIASAVPPAPSRIRLRVAVVSCLDLPLLDITAKAREGCTTAYTGHWLVTVLHEYFLDTLQVRLTVERLEVCGREWALDDVVPLADNTVPSESGSHDTEEHRVPLVLCIVKQWRLPDAAPAPVTGNQDVDAMLQAVRQRLHGDPQVTQSSSSKMRRATLFDLFSRTPQSAIDLVRGRVGELFNVAVGRCLEIPPLSTIEPNVTEGYECREQSLPAAHAGSIFPVIVSCQSLLRDGWNALAVDALVNLLRSANGVVGIKLPAKWSIDQLVRLVQGCGNPTISGSEGWQQVLSGGEVSISVANQHRRVSGTAFIPRQLEFIDSSPFQQLQVIHLDCSTLSPAIALRGGMAELVQCLPNALQGTHVCAVHLSNLLLPDATATHPFIRHSLMASRTAQTIEPKQVQTPPNMQSPHTRDHDTTPIRSPVRRTPLTGFSPAGLGPGPGLGWDEQGHIDWLRMQPAAQQALFGVVADHEPLRTLRITQSSLSGRSVAAIAAAVHRRLCRGNSLHVLDLTESVKTESSLSLVSLAIALQKSPLLRHPDPSQPGATRNRRAWLSPHLSRMGGHHTSHASPHTAVLSASGSGCVEAQARTSMSTLSSPGSSARSDMLALRRRESAMWADGGDVAHEELSASAHLLGSIRNDDEMTAAVASNAYGTELLLGKSSTGTVSSVAVNSSTDVKFVLPEDVFTPELVCQVEGTSTEDSVLSAIMSRSIGQALTLSFSLLMRRCRSLILQGSSIQDTSLEVLCNHLAEQPRCALLHLDVSNCALPPLALMKMLLFVAQRRTSLRSLDLSSPQRRPTSKPGHDSNQDGGELMGLLEQSIATIRSSPTVQTLSLRFLGLQAWGLGWGLPHVAKVLEVLSLTCVTPVNVVAIGEKHWRDADHSDWLEQAAQLLTASGAPSCSAPVQHFLFGLPTGGTVLQACPTDEGHAALADDEEMDW